MTCVFIIKRVVWEYSYATSKLPSKSSLEVGILAGSEFNSIRKDSVTLVAVVESLAILFGSLVV